jgi:hypothetical protein
MQDQLTITATAQPLTSLPLICTMQLVLLHFCVLLLSTCILPNTSSTKARHQRHGVEFVAVVCFKAETSQAFLLFFDIHSPAGTPINSGKDVNIRSAPVVPHRQGLVPSGRYSGRPQQSEGEGEGLVEHYMGPEQSRHAFV